jgi:hypothetical protein
MGFDTENQQNIWIAIDQDYPHFTFTFVLIN